ncbi:Mss4-like protein [Xylaria nigripes]|nr:Mss4-like protein [Xylaria nigripes]
MPEGSCLCGKLRYSYEGEAYKMVCHCLDCRKTSGSTYSTNFVVPETNFKVLSGTAKTFSKAADSGKVITSNFCGDCGSTLWRQTPALKSSVILKVGMLDDVAVIENAKPTIELYAVRRPNWVASIPGAQQKERL